MKKVVLSIVLILFLFSCASLQKCPSCPQTDVVIVTYPFLRPIIIQKGHFDNPENFWTLDEWKESQGKETEEPQEERDKGI